MEKNYIKQILCSHIICFKLDFLSVFLQYSKFPVSISGGVALWVKKIKTVQTEREFKRRSASPGEVHRVTAEGKFTLLFTLKPLQSESSFGINFCLFGAASQEILPWLSLPVINSLETHRHIPLKCLVNHLCSLRYWRCMFYEWLLQHHASFDHFLTGRTVKGKTSPESKTFQQLIQLINLLVLH